MKKLISFLILIGLIVFGYYYFTNNSDNENENSILQQTEDEAFYIEKYTIFGTHLNINGCIDKILDGELSLVLKDNKEEISIGSIFNSEDKTCFNLSNKNNEGIYLDSLKEGNYILLVKQVNSDEIKYYNLTNKTEYGALTYYTITNNNKNNKIDINFNTYNGKEYLNIKVDQTSLPDDVYDITIDPGHGGNDPGASYKMNGKVYNESDLTLKISLLLKEDLEDLGLKVKLTRDSDDTLSNYGSDGRSVIPNKTKSKYSLSIHINSFTGSMNYGGVEIYTPNDINYELATLFANNISNIVGYSKKATDKIDNGIYYKSFSNKDILEFKNEMIAKGLQPYNIVEGSPYMFMIREVGGISTHAYVDGREGKFNEFYNSNHTAEPYLLELGYINYESDLDKLDNKSESFAYAISKSLQEYLDIS